jgi:hypothetical protein
MLVLAFLLQLGSVGVRGLATEPEPEKGGCHAVGVVHLLLVIAVIVIVFQFIRGRRSI